VYPPMAPQDNQCRKIEYYRYLRYTMDWYYVTFCVVALISLSSPLVWTKKEGAFLLDLTAITLFVARVYYQWEHVRHFFDKRREAILYLMWFFSSIILAIFYGDGVIYTVERLSMCIVFVFVAYFMATTVVCVGPPMIIYETEATSSHPLEYSDLAALH
jgi:hypothetical protein